MILSLITAAATPAGPQWNCQSPAVQQEMNYCAQQEFLQADAALNGQWRKTAAEMKQRDADRDTSLDDRPGYFSTLLTAQRAWLKYRDAHCVGQGYSFRGGSMEPLIVSTCKTALTEERTNQLKDLIEQ